MRKPDFSNASKYIDDTKRVTSSSYRMLKFAFKVSPLFTASTLLLTVVAVLLPFAYTWVNALIIDQMIEVLGGASEFTGEIVKLFIITLSLLLLTNLLDVLTKFTDIRMFHDISREFTNVVSERIAFLDMEHFEDPELKTKLQKVIDNYSYRPQNFLSLLIKFFGPIVKIISASIILINFQPILILFLLLIAVPKFIADLVLGRRAWGIWAAKGDTQKDYWLSKQLVTTDSSLMEARIFKARDFLVKRIYDLYAIFQREQISIEKKRLLVDMGIGVFTVIGFGAVYLIIILSVLAAKITVGQFTFYIDVSRRLQDSFRAFFGRISGIYNNGLFVADIFDILDMADKVQNGDITLESKVNPPLIEFKNVSFKYPGTDIYILKDLNLTIEPGQTVAIVGENGAGKTTLVKLLMRFYDVNEGEILVDGHNLKSLDLDSWYSVVGTLFQDFNRYHFTAGENISIGDLENASDREAIVSAAQSSGADEFIDNLEFEYDQILDRSFDHGTKLSTGQWQKVALARAFFKDAPILILDEPTSAIDPKAEFEIFERLFAFAQDKTVLIISHRFSTVRNANRIIVLDDGNIIEDGSHEDLMEIKDGVYKHAFEIQRKGYE